ncbi:hypothetical protein [Bradyrhizobium sp. CCGB01]|uniref:hypothetical protein n=1 Tax=Bradyrhizobium sp. CCGB01 TaxID=2949634 RepID=UPI0020B2C8D9|nr:hypothetical protein [Bradyrhizobium sp. CCGB01]MCP3405090.1 hypothetical protein [Bradyrhizobium sp. CCGB01]
MIVLFPERMRFRFRPTSSRLRAPAWELAPRRSRADICAGVSQSALKKYVGFCSSIAARKLMMEPVMASKLFSGTVALLLVVATVLLIAIQPPAWIVLLLGSFALAVLYIVVRTRSRYDPLDPRFGSCIPPISKPRASAGDGSNPP